MSQANSKASMISDVFIRYCEQHNYQVKSSEDKNNDWRLDISDYKNRAVVTVYHTGSIVVGGSASSLKEEFENLKEDFQKAPGDFLETEIVEVKSCVQKYDILLSELKLKIKRDLSSLEKVSVEIVEIPSADVEYRARITRNVLSLTVAQYNNGTLLLQGKTDNLLNECCDLIEKIANPSGKDIVARFISCDEENLGIFAAKYTPKLINMAETNVEGKIGDVFHYLEPYDKKWFVASECLCLTQIPLPEFSPLVMPASKAFEGFVKKLLIGIGLFDSGHFKTKQGNFSALSQSDNPKRKAICAKDKHADTMLKKISLCLGMSRNFMMHSDDSKITKVDFQQEAEEKVNGIFKETQEIFDYFKGLYTLLP